MLTKVNDYESRQCSGRPGAPADQLSRCVEPIARPNSRRFFSTRKSAGNRCSRCSLVPSDYRQTVLVRSRVFRFSSLHIARGDTSSFPPSLSAASHRGPASTSTPPRTSAANRSRSTVQAMPLYIQLFSEYHTEAISLRCFRSQQYSVVVLPPLSWRSPASAVRPSGATVLFLLEVSRFRPFRRAHPFSYCRLAFGWRGVASRHFRHLPRPSPRWSMPRAPWFFSCGRTTAPPVIRSPVHLPRELRPAPQSHYSPSSSISRFHSRMFCHAFLCSRHSVSGEPRVVQPFILSRYPPQGKAYPDPEWSGRSS